MLAVLVAVCCVRSSAVESAGRERSGATGGAATDLDRESRPAPPTRTRRRAASARSARRWAAPALQSRGLVIPAGAPALPSGLTAAAWVLVDLDSGNVLAAQDPHGRYQPASILKILTVDTLLPKLPGNQTVTVSAAAAGTEGSHAGLIAGGTYTIDQLFAGLLLVSGNDAAMALAEAAGGVAQTVAAMNAKALSLGAYDTFVADAVGPGRVAAAHQRLRHGACSSRPRSTARASSAYDQQPTATLPAQHVNGNGFGAVKLVNQGTPFLTEVPGGFFSKIGYTDAAQDTYVAAPQPRRPPARRRVPAGAAVAARPVAAGGQAVRLGLRVAGDHAPVGHLDAA